MTEPAPQRIEDEPEARSESQPRLAILMHPHALLCISEYAISIMQQAGMVIDLDGDTPHLYLSPDASPESPEAENEDPYPQPAHSQCVGPEDCQSHALEEDAQADFMVVTKRASQRQKLNGTRHALHRHQSARDD